MSSDSVEANINGATFFPDSEYDSAVTINGGPISIISNNQFDGITWDPAGVRGAWFTLPAQLGAGGPNGPDDMWVARVTVSATTSVLEGQIFASGLGPNGEFGGQIPATGVIHVPNAIPAPGALTFFGLAGAAAMRRRR